ncbi:putative ORFan [Tupanvirus deep ocean]|uniref:ORFan n=1 Tax=Tupanvirus soda lake TaxID=2126985 RepID=A0AC59HBV5_9VIRU|nr:putative ORFan [Tupanvirus deep ocean]AUL79482.2 putative ORFan [Tupanvirus deep ocean]
MDNIQNVRIVKDPIYKRMMRHPFKFYGRAAGFTFCFVNVTNLATTLLGIGDSDGKKKAFFKEHPQLYFTALATKSAVFSLIWPSFYITALQSPKEAFVLGGGIDRVLTE